MAVVLLALTLANPHSLVREVPVRGIGIGVGIDSNRLQALAFGAAHDPQRNFPTIGNQ